MKMEKPQELIDAVTEKVTLNLFRVGCDKMNFLILKTLPTTTDVLSKKTELTKMPLNKRLNELEEVGLLEREKYKAILNQTVLTKEFISLIQQLEKEVITELPKLI